MDRYLKEGYGWRLGWDPNASVFKGLVGSETWSVELTAAEFQDFCRLSLQLADAMAVMADELMDEERIACEQESEHIWLEVEGYPERYGLRFMLLAGRRGEGGWSADVVPSLLQAIPALTLF